MEKEKYKIIISEPWNFQNKKGENIIEGEILHVIPPSLIVFKSNETIELENKVGDILILKPRYVNNVLELRKDKTYSGTVGIGLYLLNEYEKRDAYFLEENSIYILIGSLHKII
ncbi:MAG: hypothetical protein LBC68_13275 [Prevotellaceae bacterium]|jgi:hypothetical protein|nr:hypothetical protein [Prevotellaceae bacterium]